MQQKFYIMEKISEHSSCSAVYDAEKQRINFKFAGYLNIEEAKKMYNIVLEFMKKNEVISFLNDLKEVKGTFTNLTKWLFENMASMIELGLKYDALVLSDDIFTIFAADDFIKKATHLEVQVFKSNSEAEQWLDNR